MRKALLFLGLTVTGCAPIGYQARTLIGSQCARGCDSLYYQCVTAAGGIPNGNLFWLMGCERDKQRCYPECAAVDDHIILTAPTKMDWLTCDQACFDTNGGPECSAECTRLYR